MFRPRPRSRRPSDSRRAVAAEVLEARVLPTAYVVDTFSDAVAADGRVSLREAVLAANGNTAVNEAAAGQGGGTTDTITFSISVTGGLILLSGTKLALTDHLAVYGPVTLGGGYTNRVFEVSPGANVLLAGLTITQGPGVPPPGDGHPPEDTGGVLNFGRLSLAGCILSDNDSHIGGAVLNAAGATLDARDCLFSRNRSDIASAVFNNERGVMTLTDCRLTGNLGGPAVPSGFALRNVGTAALVRTVIDGNDGGFQNNGSMTVVGGSVYANAGDFLFNLGDLALTDVLVAGNALGLHNTGTLRVVRGRIAENGAQGLQNYGTADIAGCVIYGNAGGGIFNGGGATLVMTGSVVSANRARDGGGLYLQGTASVTDCLIANNGASADDAFPTRGGGAYVEVRGRAAFAYCVIAGNVSAGNVSAGDGGGVYNSAGGSLSLVGCTVANNAAAGAGGGVFAGLPGYESTSTVISHSTLGGNTATTGGGLLAESLVEVNDSTVSGNYASGLGGGIRAGGSGPVVYNATVFGNRAGQAGGGLYVNPSVPGSTTRPARLVNTIVAGNRRGGAGTAGTPDDVAGNPLAAGSTNNVISDAATAGGLVNGTNGNVVGVDWRAVLDPALRYNGGLTPTHALIGGSIAIDRGTVSPFATDQRGAGFPRQVGAAVDVGAFEYGVGIAEDVAGALRVPADGESLAPFWSRSEEEEVLSERLLASV